MSLAGAPAARYTGASPPCPEYTGLGRLPHSPFARTPAKVWGESRAGRLTPLSWRRCGGALETAVVPFARPHGRRAAGIRLFLDRRLSSRLRPPGHHGHEDSAARGDQKRSVRDRLASGRPFALPAPFRGLCTGASATYLWCAGEAPAGVARHRFHRGERRSGQRWPCRSGLGWKPTGGSATRSRACGWTGPPASRRRSAGRRSLFSLGWAAR